MKNSAGGSRQSQHSFAQTPAVKMARSQFDRSFGVKDTFNFDYLWPIFLDEILPGDTCNVSASVFARLSTQLVPIMDNLYIDYFFFFVPNRLVWDNWEKFCGSQDNPGDSISYVIPTLSAFPAGGPEVGTIADKFGLPTDIASGYTCGNALPFRCYNLIWNKWFRDEQLQTAATIHTDNGPDTYSDYSVRLRGKRHDYFTSCLPNPQKGTALSIGLTGNLAVASTNVAPTFTPTNTTNITNNVNSPVYMSTGNDTAHWAANSTGPSFSSVKFGSTTGLSVDLTAGTAGTINALRTAFQVQSLLELDNRGGTRYVEILQNHFNVVSPDFRLQRPEYLGGGQTKINCHPVAQTSPTSGGNYAGQLFSFGTAAGSNIGFTKSFVEHGYVIGLACARADITYQQGINRMFQRSTRYDFFWPKLQEIGEQSVPNSEIYVDGVHDASVFGYQERYAEYRYKPSEIHGQFRSNYATPLDQWHMAEAFGSVPPLDGTFIAQNTPITRALANSSSQQIIFDCFFNYKHARPMMTYSVPASLGRF